MGFIISKEFPTRFISGTEVTKPFDVTIKEVRKEKAYAREKKQFEDLLVVYFKETTRGVALKKTRAKQLADLCGSDDTDNWKGKTVSMFKQVVTRKNGDLHVIHFGESKKALSKELDSLATQ